MEVYVRVVDAGSFSAAAMQLGVGQPAVSKAIAQLEDRLGVQLIVRSTRGLALTDAGKEFFDNAKRAIDGVNHAERVARGGSGLTGRLRVSTSVCFARLHVMPRLPEYLAQCPDVDIEVEVDDRFVNLAEERVDLALRTSVGSLTDSSLTARKIGQAQVRVMATRAYWEKHGKPTTPEQLSSHACVILERNGRLLDDWLFRKGALEAAVKTRGRMKVTSPEGLRDAMLAGVGVVVVSEWLYSPELASGLVEPVLDDWELPKQSLWAVFPPGGSANPKARDFVAFVERCMLAPFAPMLSTTGLP